MNKNDIKNYKNIHLEISKILNEKSKIILEVYFSKYWSYTHFAFLEDVFELSFQEYCGGYTDFDNYLISFDEFLMDNSEFKEYTIQKKKKEDEQRRLWQEKQRVEEQIKREDVERMQYLKLKEKYGEQ